MVSGKLLVPQSSLRVSILYHVSCRCASMVMMVLFETLKYSLLRSSTYCSSIHSVTDHTIQGNLIKKSYMCYNT